MRFAPPLGQVLMAALLAATAGLLATGCSPTGARAGVGLPPAFIYKNYKVPLTVARPEEGAGPSPRALEAAKAMREAGIEPPIPKGIKFPEGMKMVKVRTYALSPLNIPGVPGGGLVSFGWGDMSERRWLEEGGMERFVYADAAELDILRIFNQVTIYAWGLPEDVAAEGRPDQTAPPAGVAEQLGVSSPSAS